MFTPVNGGIDISVTNTAGSPFAKAQSVTGLDFTVSGISAPTQFTEFKGRMDIYSDLSSWTTSSGSTFDDKPATPVTPVGAIDHWGFNVTGSNVVLQTVSSPVPGAGNPQYMIIPASGSESGNDISNGGKNFTPFVLGTADFFLTVPGITTLSNLSASNFTNISVLFGTGPEATLGTTPGVVTPNVTPVPLPAATWMGMGTLGAMGIGAKIRRRRSA